MASAFHTDEGRQFILCQRKEFSILKNRDGGEIAELTCLPVIFPVVCERSKTNKLKGGISPPIVAESRYFGQ